MLLTFQKLVCIFAKRPALRFLSHHDLMRTFHRALRRAGLPVRHTQGYNPRPRVVFPHALELGISSVDEPVEIELDGWVPPAEFAERLERALPEGLDVREVSLMPPRRRGSKAVEAHYEASLTPEDVDAARSGVERFMESDSWPFERVDHRAASGSTSKDVMSTALEGPPPLGPHHSQTLRARDAKRCETGGPSSIAVLTSGAPSSHVRPNIRRGRVASGSASKVTRRGKGETRRIDLRPHVLALSVEGTSLRMRLRLGQPGAARPREVVAAVLDRPGEAMLDVPLRKTRTVLAGPV